MVRVKARVGVGVTAVKIVAKQSTTGCHDVDSIAQSCEAVDNISTDTTRHLVPLRQLSFLFWSYPSWGETFSGVGIGEVMQCVTVKFTGSKTRRRIARLKRTLAANTA